MKLVLLSLITGLLACTVQDVLAFDFSAGNSLWGKYSIQICQSCHKEHKIAVLDPKKRSAKEWDDFFVNNYQKLKESNHDFSSVGINDRQLENIHRYLVDNASKVGTTKTTKNISTAATKKSSSANISHKKVESSEVRKFDMSKGDAIKGGYIFRKCISCHKKNKITVSPADRPRKSWSRFFDRDFRKFKKYMPDFDSYKFTISQMEHLHQFLLKYALDSEKPKTCK